MHPAVICNQYQAEYLGKSVNALGQNHIPPRADIQGLRAVAVILVVIAHCKFPILTGGFIGVDIFFVISGYLISGLLVKQYQQSGRIQLASFFANRLKRLLPVLLLVLLTTSVLCLVFLSGSEISGKIKSGIFAATWTSNLFFAFNEINYFNELADSDIFLHTWSLAVEEQFYLIWPITVLVILKFCKNKKHTILCVSLLALSSFLLSMYLTTNAPRNAFYLMPPRIWQFACGALLYLILDPAGRTKHTLTLSNRLKVYFLLTGLSLIAGSAFLLHPHMTYPGAWAILPTFATVLIIASGQNTNCSVKKLLENPLFIWIGDRSYSIYLWHWPLLTLNFAFGDDRLWSTLCMVAITMALAALSYKYVEKPLWKGKHRHASPRAILLHSSMATAVAVTGFLIILNSLSFSVDADTSSRWRDVPDIYSKSCDTWYHNSEVNPCTYGTESAIKTVVLLGDSISAQWFSFVPQVFPEPNWRTVVLTKSACPMVDEDIFYPRIGKVYDVCTTWRNKALNYLDGLKPDVIIMGSAATYEISNAQWIDGSTRVFSRLNESANTVIVIPGTPTLGFDGPNCLARKLDQSLYAKITSPSECKAERRLEAAEIVKDHLTLATSSFPNFHLLDLNDLVCSEGVCRAGDPDGIAVYRDSQHLTDSFVKSMTPEIRKRIVSLGIIPGESPSEQVGKATATAQHEF